MEIRRRFLSNAKHVAENLAFLSPILAAVVLAVRIAHVAMSRLRAGA